MFFVSSDVKRTLVKVPLLQLDLGLLMKMNTSLSGCE